MKKITAIITVFAILFAVALPAWADDNYVAVSEGKPIEALVGPGEGNPQYANDSSATSRYTGNKNYSNNALTIDLERKYVLDHVAVTVSNAATSSVYVSNSSEFDTYVELEFDRTESYVSYYKIASDYIGEAYRYVRYNFTTSTRDVLIRNFQAYVTEENMAGDGPQLLVPAVFEEELVIVSTNKPIVSKTYGTGSGWGDNVVANAVDDDMESQYLGCPYRDQAEWVTIDLEEEIVINKIESVFSAERTYGVYVTNTSYGQGEEFTDGTQLEETSSGSKKFVLPEEHKNAAFRYVRLRFEGDAPNTGSTTEQNVYVKDIKVYTSSRDVVYNTASGKCTGLTDGDIETAVTIANNTVIDLLAPTYISSYKLFGADKDNVTIKGSLFNESVENMIVIPEKTTENIKYRYIAIESNSGEAVSLNEIKVYAFFTDVVTPWAIDEDACSVTVTNTSHKDERTYTFNVTAFDEYDTVVGTKTETKQLKSGETNEVKIEVIGLDNAKKVVCTIGRDEMLVSEPAIFIDGDKVNAPTGTSYTTAPERNIETIVTKTDYFDGLELTASETNGILDSDILTFCVYNSSGQILTNDAKFAGGTFKYRLPGDAPSGEYKARLLVTDALGNAIRTSYEFTKAAPLETDVTAAINAFANATTDAEVQAAYQEHYVTKGTISFSDIPEAEALLNEGVGDSFIKMLSARQLWKKNAETSLTAEDIRDCMKAAVIENSLENDRANTQTVLTKYASRLDNVFDGNQNNVYLPEIFKKGAQDNETLIYNMKLAATLSQMKNASSEKIADVLQNYSDILSVDLDDIRNSGVDILLVARRLNNAIPESYLDGLAAEVAEILGENEVPEENDRIDPPDEGGYGVGGGSSSGGSSGGGSTTTENKKEEQKPVEKDTPTAPVEPTESGETGDEETITFNDVADSFWAAKSISKLADAEIVSGRGDGNFDPDSNVSRAEFATMLVRAFKLISKPEEKPEFTDCKVSDWFYPYIDAALTNDIVNGISETEFEPNATIKRQDACVMSYNMMVYKNYLKYFEGKSFNDSEVISAYAKDAVDMLSGSGVINGFVDGSFRPHEQLSRAQAAVIVHNLMVLLGEEV